MFCSKCGSEKVNRVCLTCNPGKQKDQEISGKSHNSKIKLFQYVWVAVTVVLLAVFGLLAAGSAVSINSETVRAQRFADDVERYRAESIQKTAEAQRAEQERFACIAENGNDPWAADLCSNHSNVRQGLEMEAKRLSDQSTLANDEQWIALDKAEQAQGNLNNYLLIVVFILLSNVLLVVVWRFGGNRIRNLLGSIKKAD